MCVYACRRCCLSSLCQLCHLCLACTCFLIACNGCLCSGLEYTAAGHSFHEYAFFRSLVFCLATLPPPARLNTLSCMGLHWTSAPCVWCIAHRFHHFDKNSVLWVFHPELSRPYNTPSVSCISYLSEGREQHSLVIIVYKYRLWPCEHALICHGSVWKVSRLFAAETLLLHHFWHLFLTVVMCVFSSFVELLCKLNSFHLKTCSNLAWLIQILLQVAVVILVLLKSCFDSCRGQGQAIPVPSNCTSDKPGQELLLSFTGQQFVCQCLVHQPMSWVLHNIVENA